jgi:F420-dependent oxidoreductase-like protein
MATLRFGIKMAQMDGTYGEMLEAWQEADRLGFDTAWCHDHLLNQRDAAGPQNEGWTVLTAMLAQSERIRGGIMVAANTYRHPSILAKMATTLDQISNGRLEVGLGAGGGWLGEDEHRQYGLRFPPLRERMQRLEEACQVLVALWTEQRATVGGAYYQLDGAYHEPKPVQRPHPPLVIGTLGEQIGLRIAARYAQEWNMPLGTAEEFARKSALLDQHCEEIGRDPREIERSIQFLPDFVDRDPVELGREFIAAGATHLIYTCPTRYGAENARRLWESIVAPLRG